MHHIDLIRIDPDSKSLVLGTKYILNARYVTGKNNPATTWGPINNNMRMPYTYADGPNFHNPGQLVDFTPGPSCKVCLCGLFAETVRVVESCKHR